MKLLSGTAQFDRIKSPCLVKFCREAGFKKDPELSKLDASLAGTIGRIFDSGEFKGKLNEAVVLHSVPGVSADRVILAGLGETEKVDGDSYRQAAGTLSKLTAVRKSESIAFYLGDDGNEKIVSAIVEGFMLGRFDMDDYKTNDDKKNDKLRTVCFYGRNRSQAVAIKKGISRGHIVSDGVILARRMATHPGNFLTPKRFSSEAQSLARRHGFMCNTLDEKKIEAERMGALLAVAKGSNEPPRFLILRYNGTRPAARPVALVGKGITFDSGGISLKPVLDMHEMKGDMQGAAIVLGTLVTIARLKLPLNVIGLIPLAENMPSSTALKPGDIIKSRKGKTVEIISTDAEGRLILADALDYANRFKPQAVIDIATLTGAALYVLGYTAMPILGNNKELMDAIRISSDATAEKVWEMPIWDEYRDLMKSPVADLKNSAGKQAGTITAAAFLENFIGDWPWAHIDIAYVDIEKTGRPYVPKGASGVGLRLLVELLSNWEETRA